MGDLSKSAADLSVSLVDDAAATPANVLTSAPVGTEGGIVTRNIPSGTQTVSSKSPLTAASPTTVSVGITSASAVASNSSRKGLILTNLSTNNISFGIGVAAVLNNGITLVPNGVWEMDEFSLSTAAINAIASGASSTLAVQEFS